jgi:hypothetical protein
VGFIYLNIQFIYKEPPNFLAMIDTCCQEEAHKKYSKIEDPILRQYLIKKYSEENSLKIKERYLIMLFKRSFCDY